MSTLPPRPTQLELACALGVPSPTNAEQILAAELLHLQAEVEALRTEIALLDNLETAQLHEARAEVAALREALDWQNVPNSRLPTRGGYEFYINEEWTCVRNAALGDETGCVAALRKTRYDPDDERVRIRRVLDDDAILADLKKATDEVAALREALTTIAHCDDKVYVGEDHGSQIWSRLNGAVRTAEAALGTQPHPQPEPPQPRTVREWLETIPCPQWRAAALARVSPIIARRTDFTALWAVVAMVEMNDDDGCEYEHSHDAWIMFQNAIRDNTPLPPCPFGKECA